MTTLVKKINLKKRQNKNKTKWNEIWSPGNQWQETVICTRLASVFNSYCYRKSLAGIWAYKSDSTTMVLVSFHAPSEVTRMIFKISFPTSSIKLHTN